MCYLHNWVCVKVQGDKGLGLFVLRGFTGGGPPSSPQQRHRGEPKMSEPDSPHSCCSSADTRKGFSQQERVGGSANASTEGGEATDRLAFSFSSSSSSSCGVLGQSEPLPAQSLTSLISFLVQRRSLASLQSDCCLLQRKYLLLQNFQISTSTD